MSTPKITTAVHVKDYQLKLTFDDGKTGIIDLSDQLWGEVFEPLRDIEQFKSFQVDTELSTIVWATGADLTPEFLYQAVV